MSDESISCLRQMDKEELIRQILSLRKENETSLGRLQNSEDRFQVFAENVQAAVYMINEHGEIIYANPFMLSLTGYTRDELITAK